MALPRQTLHAARFFYIISPLMKKSLTKAAVLIALLMLSCATLLTCSKKIGYGVVNWSIPEYNLTATDIVPVRIRSNISKVYIVEINKQLVEIPLWQLAFFHSKNEAKSYIQKMAEYRSLYASVMADGLPLRATPNNTAKQVYRLKKNQTLKILWKGEGDPVIAKDKPLEGDWFQVMTNDGTRGWCFSHNLRMYDEHNTAIAQVKQEVAVDDTLQTIVQSRWYPDYYREMITKETIDPSRMSEGFGFFLDGTDEGSARIVLKDTLLTFSYDSIKKSHAKGYIFIGAPLALQIKDEGTIIVQYTDNKGNPQIYQFVTLPENQNPAELVAAEKERRASVISLLYEVGPAYNSGNYGRLHFADNNRFFWDGYHVLSPSIISKDAGTSGYVQIQFLLSDKLKADYHGVLSFQFDNSKETVNFLYTHSSQGLKLEYIKPEHIQDGIAVARNLNPIILFFSPDEDVF